MVAVTGSMSTAGLGYPKWDEFCIAIGEIADQLVNDILLDHAVGCNKYSLHHVSINILNNIKIQSNKLIDEISKGNKLLDPRVRVWMLFHYFDMFDQQMISIRNGLVFDNYYRRLSSQTFRERIARIFLSRTARSAHPESTPIHELINSLGIKRYITLNYDLELERALMLREDERSIIKFAAQRAQSYYGMNSDRFSDKAANPRLRTRSVDHYDYQISEISDFIGSDGSGKPITRYPYDILCRRMTNGLFVESNVVDRERPDRLIEFAVGSGEIDRHIFHLHGRADVPNSLVSHIRDYDRLYRLDDLYRDPFDYGLKVLFGGSPIIFVDVGMSEDEVNQTLQYFVSNAPLRRSAPLFLLWSAGHLEDTDDRAAFVERHRLNLWAKLGVRVIYDTDLIELEDTHAVVSQRGSCSTVSTRDPDVENRQRLVASIAKLPGLAQRLRQSYQNRRLKWRSLTGRLDQLDPDKKLPHRLWGTAKLTQLAHEYKESGTDKSTDERYVENFVRIRKHERGEVPKRTNVIFAYAEVGFGRGLLAELFGRLSANDYMIGEDVLVHTAKADRLIVHAGFSYDSDAMLNGITQFLNRPVASGSTDDQSAEKQMVFCREERIADGSLFQMRPALIVINGVDRFFSLNGVPLSAELDLLIRSAIAAGERSQVQFLLLGTERLRPYANLLQRPLHLLESPKKAPPASEPDRDTPPLTRIQQLAKLDPPAKLGSRYFEWVAECFSRARQSRLEELEKMMGRNPRLASACERCDITPSAMAAIQHAIVHDRDSLRREFFSAYLSPMLLQALGVHCPETFEILRTLCFIGAPVEAGVLLHAPKVWAILAENSKDRDRPGTNRRTDLEVVQRLVCVINKLIDLGLLLEIDEHDPSLSEGRSHSSDGSTCGSDASQTGETCRNDVSLRDVLWKRVGLHRSLASYLRDQHGAPINDAKLATTFNMSLFMIEPGDNYTPESHFHEEIGDLIDSLTGSWHDLKRIYCKYNRDSVDNLVTYPTSDCNDEIKANFEQSLRGLYIHPDDRDHALSSVSARATREASACLRAALLLIRGYFSTGALLKIDTQPNRSPRHRFGALTEHAARLGRLIDAFGSIATARAMVRLADESRKGEERDEIARRLGPEPLYPDDLVWLYNERGVILLAQGQLFDAREAFSIAGSVNERFVETGGYFGHNSRRIALNRIAMLIERGQPKSAAKLLDKIELSINQAFWCRSSGQIASDESSHCVMERVSEIRWLFSDTEVAPPIHGTMRFTREEMMVVGMTTGYRGLVAHLRGHHHQADMLYKVAIRILRGLSEQRAYAHFERHRAVLQGFFGNSANARETALLAVSAAQSAMQMDILHRASIVAAGYDYHLASTETERRRAIESVKQALHYASQSDCYRVQIEASSRLARVMRRGGDYDTALRYAAEALAVASRYGHSLQKTDLRIEIGKILRLRGDPISGQALLERANEIAVSSGNHIALEQVRRARATSAVAAAQ